MVPMLKRIVYLSAIFSLGVGSFGFGQPSEITDDHVEYRITSDKYSVIFINRDNAPQGEARKSALEYAAETAKKNGYRYFKIQEEQKVMVAHSEPYDQPEWDNLYEEQIIQGESGVKYFERRTTPESVNIYPGYKVTFQCYKDKPKGSSYDACSFADW